MKYFYILILTWACAIAGAIDGTVTDSATGEPLIGATVQVKGTNFGTFTDYSGAFRIEGIDDGPVIITISSAGYSPLETTIAVSERAEVLIEMDQAAMGATTIVVTGTGTPHFFKDTPVTTSVVSREMIEQRSKPDLFGVLDLSTGVRVENNCQNCNFSQVRIHGLEGQYTQILIDGDPVVSSLAKVYGLEQFPAEMVERIEVVKGGGSALYGGSAVAGVINIITRRPEESFTSFNLEGGYVKGGGEGGFSFTTAAADIGGDASMVLYGRLRHRTDVDVDEDGFSDIGRLRSESVGGNLFLDPTNSTSLTISAHYIHEDRRGGDSLQVPEHLVDIAEGTETWRYGGSLKWKQSLSEVFDYSLNLSGAYTDRSSFYGGLGGEDPTSPDYDPAAGYGSSQNPLFSAQAKCNLRIGPQLLSAGMQATREHLKDESFTEGSRPIDETYSDLGIFVQDDIIFGSDDQFEILLGSRMDSHSQVDGIIISPRTALRWSVNPSVTLRVGVTTGFNPPQIFDEDLHIEVVGGSPRIIVNADDLKEEKSTSFYLSGEYRDFVVGMPVSFAISGFRTEMENAFALVEIGESQYGELIFERVNEGGAHVQGIEAEAGLKKGSISIFAGVTMQEAVYDEQVELFDGVWSNRIMRTPNVYGNLSFEWDMARNMSLLLSSNYTGSMEVPHDTDLPEIVTTDPTVTFDADVAWTLDSGLLANNVTLKAGLENITDQFQEDLDQGAERDAGYVYGPSSPRKIILGVEVGF